jgi:hypothetical protein
MGWLQVRPAAEQNCKSYKAADPKIGHCSLNNGLRKFYD